MKPRLLDLFCGAGGATKGYQQAGFYVVGVDWKPQPHYCGDELIEADAILWIRANIDLIQRHFQAVHASPPCQKYSWSAKRWRNIDRADLVAPVRELLNEIGLPYIIENVIGAPLRRQITLCGRMFNLPLLRHRLFESNQMLFAPVHPRHGGSVRGGDFVTVAGHGGDNQKGRGSRAAKQEAMGITWMDDIELNEAIPPCYTEFIGRQLIAALSAVR